MVYSTSLNNFKKVMAVATAFATVACLVPTSAQALDVRNNDLLIAEGKGMNPGNPLEQPNVEVPEPDATVSLLGVGALGVLLLIKRNRCASKLAKSRLTISE